MVSNNKIGDAIFKVSRLMKGDMMFQCYAARLSLLQLHALLLLKQHTQLSMREIADNFNVEMATATSLLNKLVSLRLVKRQEDKNDRRIVRIELTQKGKKVLTEALQQRQKKITMMLALLSSQEKNDLLAILEKIIHNYEK